MGAALESLRGARVAQRRTGMSARTVEPLLRCNRQSLAESITRVRIDRVREFRSRRTRSHKHGKTRAALSRFSLRSRSATKPICRYWRGARRGDRRKVVPALRVEARIGAYCVGLLGRIDIRPASASLSSPILAATHACFTMLGTLIRPPDGSPSPRCRPPAARRRGSRARSR